MNSAPAAIPVRCTQIDRQSLMIKLFKTILIFSVFFIPGAFEFLNSLRNLIEAVGGLFFSF